MRTIPIVALSLVLAGAAFPGDPPTPAAAADLLDSRIRGSLIGSAIGDAFGGPVEFAEADRVRSIVGSDWVDRFVPYPADFLPNPWGVWDPAAPRGAGTDDTRINQVFVECAIRYGGAMGPQLLAIEYIERYRDRERFYPRHVRFAEEHFTWFLSRSAETLGMRELPWGKKVVPEMGPSLMGLISLAPAGLLFRNEPGKAYRRAHEADIVDLGYAKECTGILAAMVSAALAEGATAKGIVRAGLDADPLGLGADRPAAKALRRFVALAEEARSDRALVDAIAAEVKSMGKGVFDPIEALGVATAALVRADGDPIRTIVIAVNDRDLDGEGRLVKLRDVDCTASIAGAIAGALRGIEAFPEEWVRDAVEANRKVYGFDLEENARRFRGGRVRQSDQGQVRIGSPYPGMP